MTIVFRKAITVEHKWYLVKLLMISQTKQDLIKLSEISTNLDPH